jgi:hypothetical protein
MNQPLTPKEIVDNYFTTNQKELHQYCLTLSNRVNRPDLTTTLITSAYMYVIDNLDKFNDAILANKIGGHVKNYVTKQIVWSKTDLKKQFIYQDDMPAEPINDEDEDSYLDKRNFTEPDEDDEMYEKEFEHQNKINHILYQYESLSIPNKIVYDLAIVGEYNGSGKLSRYIECNRTTCYHLIRSVKEHLRAGYKPINK